MSGTIFGGIIQANMLESYFDAERKEVTSEIVQKNYLVTELKEKLKEQEVKNFQRQPEETQTLTAKLEEEQRKIERLEKELTAAAKLISKERKIERRITVQTSMFSENYTDIEELKERLLLTSDQEDKIKKIVKRPFFRGSPKKNEELETQIKSILYGYQITEYEKLKKEKEEKSKKRLDEYCLSTLSIELGLVPEQKGKLLSIIEGHSHDPSKLNPLELYKKQNFQTDLKYILTAEQSAKFDKFVVKELKKEEAIKNSFRRRGWRVS